jgi:ABC-type transporter Mla subunit MlaD
MIPTVHLNGTSADELVEQLCAVSNKLVDAIYALRGAAPNGRDFYPQGPDALNKAIAEHSARVTKLLDLKAEIDTLAEKVADQEVRS